MPDSVGSALNLHLDSTLIPLVFISCCCLAIVLTFCLRFSFFPGFPSLNLELDGGFVIPAILSP